jgi:hypothetical protein
LKQNDQQFLFQEQMLSKREKEENEVEKKREIEHMMR